MSVMPIRSDGQPGSSGGRSLYLTEADSRQAFKRLVASQAAFSKAQLCDRQAELLGPQGLLSTFSRQIARQGRQAMVLDDLLELEDRERQQEAEKAVDFVLGVHNRRVPTDNPFSALSRQALCCVVFDDSAPYTLAERFAAADMLRQRDSLYFIKLIATTRDTVERRLVFTGLLEHFDSLLPIEQSIYPHNYRSAQQRLLHKEEALYGRLELKKTISELLEEHSPQWLLDNVCGVKSAAR